MKRVIKLTESDVRNIIKKILIEQENINPKNLKFGDRGSDVIELQQKLIDMQLLKTKTGKPTGYFGNLTNKALAKAQGQPEPKNIESNIQTKKPQGASYLLFDGQNLTFFQNGKVFKVWKAYSGRTKWNTFGDKTAQKYVDTVGQDPKQFMKVGNAGPIPAGEYTISEIQKRTNPSSNASAKLCTGKNYKQLLDLMMKSSDHDWNTGTTGDLIAWGDYRCPITPIKGTNTFGRGSFYVHGGGIAGSIGCIDLLLNMQDFANSFQTWKNNTGNNTLKLVVRY